MTNHELHQSTLVLAKTYLKNEGELLEKIYQVNERLVYRDLGFNSLFQYVCKGLGIPESRTSELVRVARKSEAVPELKAAVCQGELTIPQSRRIVSVITPENQKEWIEKAKILPQRELEREVKAALPEEKIRERIRPVALERSELRVGISLELEKKIRRVQDLESQRLKRAVSMEEALDAMASVYLEKKDPVQKASRAVLRRQRPSKVLPSGKRVPLPASLKHAVMLRDLGQCVHVDGGGNRCTERRWIEVHHRIPVSLGGANCLDNLELVCSGHHRVRHRGELAVHS